MKKNLLFLNLIRNKYIIEDYIEQDLEESFEILFENAEDKGIICFLFLIDEKNLNFQKIKIVLKDDRVSFYYYIPFFETIDQNNNLLLIGFRKSDIFYFDYLFKNFIFIINSEIIVNYLIKNIHWESTDLCNHYLYWTNDSQIVVSSYLDFVCGGLVMLLPKTWQN